MEEHAREEQEQLGISLPGLAVSEVEGLLAAVYEQREEVVVGGALYNLLLRGGAGQKVELKDDLFASDWSVKEEPVSKSWNSDQEEAEAGDYCSDDEVGFDVCYSPKDEINENKPLKRNAKETPRKHKLNENFSSGEEWEEYHEQPTSKSKKKSHKKIIKDPDEEDEENDSSLSFHGPKRCNKCGRVLKGHALPRHSKCELLGVDEEGLLAVEQMRALYQLRKKKAGEKWRESLNGENVFSTGLLKLPCERLSCDVCEIESFTSEFAVFAHIRKVHGPKEQLKCEEDGCDGKSFKNIGALKYHISKCHEEKAPCPECGTTDYSLLKNHMRSKHPRPCSPKSCDQCGKVFTNFQSFKSHVDKGHGPKGNLYGSSQFAVSKMLSDFERECHCNINLSSRQKKLDHFKLFHLDYKQCPKCDKIVQDPDGPHKCTREKPAQPKGPFICQHCGKEFNTQGGRYCHISTAHSTETVQCHICAKSFNKTAIYPHMLSHKPKEPCTICGKVVSKMRNHMETMHQNESEMKHRCDVCGRGFSTPQKMRDHNMSVHLKLRPYKCR